MYIIFWVLLMYLKNNMREGRQTQWENIKISIWITAKTWTLIGTCFPVWRTFSEYHFSFPPVLRNFFFLKSISFCWSAVNSTIFKCHGFWYHCGVWKRMQVREEKNITTYDILIKRPTLALEKQISRKVFLYYQNSHFCKKVK